MPQQPPKRRTGLVVTLLIVVALIFGGGGTGLGWLLFHDKGSPAASDRGEQRRIDMACELAFDLEGNVPAADDQDAWAADEWKIGNTGTSFRDLSSIGALLGGMVGMDGDDGSWEAMGRDLVRGASIVSLEQMKQTYDDVLEACKAR